MKPELNKGKSVMCTVVVNGQDTLQPGVIVDRAGKGAIVRMASGKKKFFFAKDLTVEEAPAFVSDAKITPPKHLEPKPIAPVRLPEQTLGGLIAATRKEAGLSQSEFGGFLGIATGLLADYERDRSRPTDDDLLRFAEAFDIDLALLIARTETCAARCAPSAKMGADEAGCDQADPTPDQADPTDSAESGFRLADETVESPPLPIVAARPIPIVPARAPVATVPEEPVSPGQGSVGVSGGDFSDFIDRLSEVSPLPLDREKRRRWVGIARSLFELVD